MRHNFSSRAPKLQGTAIPPTRPPTHKPKSLSASTRPPKNKTIVFHSAFLFTHSLCSLFDCCISCCLRVPLLHCSWHFVWVHCPPPCLDLRVPLFCNFARGILFARMFACIPCPLELIPLFARTPLLSCCSRCIVCTHVFACIHCPVMLIALFTLNPFLSCWSRCSPHYVCAHPPVPLLAAFVSMLSHWPGALPLSGSFKCWACEWLIRKGMSAMILFCIETLLFQCRMSPGIFARSGRNIPILLESYSNAKHLDT